MNLSVAAEDGTVFRPDGDNWVGWKPGEGDAQQYSDDEMLKYYPEALERWQALSCEA